MLLNFVKCKCIHIGHGNMDKVYKMGDAILGRTTQENDLGVTFSADVKVSEQCGIAASKGNKIIGLIRRTITYKEKHSRKPGFESSCCRFDDFAISFIPRCHSSLICIKEYLATDRANSLRAIIAVWLNASQRS